MTPLDLRLIANRIGFPLSRQAEAKLVARYGSNEHRANLALYEADCRAEQPEKWCDFVSIYLDMFGLSALSLKDTGGTCFDRLCSKSSAAIEGDNRVSVILAVYNSSETLPWAVQSILDQTWRNLEVILVDDASTDDTWLLATRIAEKDSRLKILRNSVNVGPFVSRNRALPLVTGDYITGHDGDDWAHPQKIERQIAQIRSTRGSVGIGNMMLRIDEKMRFRHFRDQKNRIVDRPANLHPVSSLFRTEAFRQCLGHWDSVRFSADGELVKRAQKVFGRGMLPPIVSNLSLDRPGSIMNDPIHGRRTGRRKLSPSRVAYRKSYNHWHLTLDANTSYLPFPLEDRKFPAPDPMIVPLDAVKQLLREQAQQY